MLKVSSDMAVQQVKKLAELATQSPTLFFDNFIDCLADIYNQVELPDFVKLPKSNIELLKGDFTPARIIDLRPIKEQMYYGKCKMWANPSNKEFSLHGFGLIDNNKAKPSTFTLFDTSPHMFEGGATGHGKSVALNDIIMAGGIVHPPWKVQYFLNDPKIVELKAYATSQYVMPHVNTVAATEDPDYTISMLKYVIGIMTIRNDIFVKAQVKNIDSFQKITGLEMPMLILVLDECKSMYLKAAKKAQCIDTLIELFVSLARNAGGRAILASQQVVTEMSGDTMANINIRACLGCNPKVSTATIGNVGAAINLGVMGKITVNCKPGDGNIKENTYLTTPFLPDKELPQSKNIHQVFQYLYEKWELCGGGRLEPLSFFDDKQILTRKEYLMYITGKASLGNFFFGEPAFIYKNKYRMFNFSFLPTDRFDTSLGANLLCVSPIASMRYNMIAIILANLQEIGKKLDCFINVFSTIKVVQDKVLDMGFRVDKTDYAMDVEQVFYQRIKLIMYRNIECTVDERVFEGKESKPSILADRVLEAAGLTKASILMKKRAYTMITMLNESKSMLILGMNPLTDKTIMEYANYIYSLINDYKNLGVEHKQLLPENFKTTFNIFVEFDQLKGVEIKTIAGKLEQWFDIIRLGPLYRVYTIIVSSTLMNSAGSISSAFQNLLFYSVPESSLNAYRGVRDWYPETIGSILYVYVNRKLPSDICFKVKFPRLLDDLDEDISELVKDEPEKEDEEDFSDWLVNA